MTGRMAAVVMCIAFTLGVLLGGYATVCHYKYGLMSDSLGTVRVPEVSRRDIDRELIRMDILHVGTRIGLSVVQQEEYVRAVDVASERYGIPHLLLHAVCFIESGYNPLAAHPEIRVRGRTTQAVGLMGIVWEYHAGRLQAEGIASTRMELTKPAVNLMAAACILQGMMHDIVQDYAVSGRTLTDTSVFREIVRRYYGAYNDGYQQRMLTKIRDTAGRQWMRRVAQDLIYTFRQDSIITVVPSDTLREVQHATFPWDTLKGYSFLDVRSDRSTGRITLPVVAGKSTP